MPSIVLPLQSAVYFLEATLSSCGMTLEDEAVQTREALRKRYRQLMKAAGRISRDDFSSSSAPLRFCLSEPAPEPEARSATGRMGTFVSEASCTIDVDARGIVVMTPTKETRAASSLDVVPPNLWLPNATAPLLASTRVTQLDAALRIGLAGRSLSSRSQWSPHNGPNQRESRRSAEPHAPFPGAMYFVFGFFGSHKVDARNNPRRSSCNYSGVLRETPRPS